MTWTGQLDAVAIMAVRERGVENCFWLFKDVMWETIWCRMSACRDLDGTYRGLTRGNVTEIILRAGAILRIQVNVLAGANSKLTQV